MATVTKFSIIPTIVPRMISIIKCSFFLVLVICTIFLLASCGDKKNKPYLKDEVQTEDVDQSKSDDSSGEKNTDDPSKEADDSVELLEESSTKDNIGDLKTKPKKDKSPIISSQKELEDQKAKSEPEIDEKYLPSQEVEIETKIIPSDNEDKNKRIVNDFIEKIEASEVVLKNKTGCFFESTPMAKGQAFEVFDVKLECPNAITKGLTKIMDFIPFPDFDFGFKDKTTEYAEALIDEFENYDKLKKEIYGKILNFDKYINNIIQLLEFIENAKLPSVTTVKNIFQSKYLLSVEKRESLKEKLYQTTINQIEDLSEPIHENGCHFDVNMVSHMEKFECGSFKNAEFFNLVYQSCLNLTKVVSDISFYQISSFDLSEKSYTNAQLACEKLLKTNDLAVKNTPSSRLDPINNILGKDLFSLVNEDQADPYEKEKIFKLLEELIQNRNSQLIKSIKEKAFTKIYIDTSKNSNYIKYNADSFSQTVTIPSYATKDVLIRFLMNQPLPTHIDVRNQLENFSTIKKLKSEIMEIWDQPLIIEKEESVTLFEYIEGLETFKKMIFLNRDVLLYTKIKKILVGSTFTLSRIINEKTFLFRYNSYDQELEKVFRFVN